MQELELELMLINMDDDSGLEGIDEGDWDEWLVDAFCRLKDSPKLKIIDLEASSGVNFDLTVLQSRLAEGGVHLSVTWI